MRPLSLDTSLLLDDLSSCLTLLVCVSIFVVFGSRHTYTLLAQKLAHFLHTECVDVALLQWYWAGGAWDDQEGLERI